MHLTISFSLRESFKVVTLTVLLRIKIPTALSQMLLLTALKVPTPYFVKAYSLPPVARISIPAYSYKDGTAIRAPRNLSWSFHVFRGRPLSGEANTCFKNAYSYILGGQMLPRGVFQIGANGA